MTTFAVLKDKIARDLGSDLALLHGDEIGQAVKDAIEFYQNERFWFLEDDDTSITTVSGTASYALPSDVIELDSVTVTATGATYQLTPRTWHWYREREVVPSQTEGQPTSYAIYEGRLYFYPTPNGAYPVTLWKLKRLTALSADADTNAWTTAPASELIRAHAKADLYANRLQMPDKAMIAQTVVQTWLSRVRGQSVQRVATGFVTPTCF